LEERKMTNKTVDVIIDMTGFPHVLEVVDTEDINVTIERADQYKAFYENVNVFFGVKLHSQ
jgi:diaminopimelate epimerase